VLGERRPANLAALQQSWDLVGCRAGAAHADPCAREPGECLRRRRRPGRAGGGESRRFHRSCIDVSGLERSVEQHAVRVQQLERALDRRLDGRPELGDELVDRPRSVQQRHERRQEEPGGSTFERDDRAAVLEHQAAGLLHEAVPGRQRRPATRVFECACRHQQRWQQRMMQSAQLQPLEQPGSSLSA
jgi:hypothetical protein